MSEAIVLEAESRADIGKGASRRLRRLENKVPAIIYGGGKEPTSITFRHNKIVKALENESIYASVFTVNVDGKAQSVILKDLQRHPYKPLVMHMDLQRVSAKEVITKSIPIHFLNEDVCVGVKEGGAISHNMTDVEIKCQAKDLPEFIEVDMAAVENESVIHLSELNMPKGVELTADVSESSHDHPVVSIHIPKAAAEPEEESGEASDESSAESE